MPESTAARMAVAERVWRLMFDFLVRSAPDRTRSLGKRGLTPNDSRALFSLDPHQGRTMRSLADEWNCDPSNATWVVDRLVRGGLAERRSVPHDRRVNLIVLTAKGHKTKAELMDEFHRPPAEVAALDREELNTLLRLLSKLSPPAAGPVPPYARDVSRSGSGRKKPASRRERV